MAVFSLWFLGAVRAHVRRAEEAPGRLSATAFGAGALSVGLFVLGSALLTPIAGELTYDKSNFTYDPALDHHLTLLLGALAYIVLASAGTLAAGLFGAVGIVTLRTGVFPRWFGIASVVGAVPLLVSGFLGLAPVLLIPVWTIVASVLTIRALGTER